MQDTGKRLAAAGKARRKAVAETGTKGSFSAALNLATARVVLKAGRRLKRAGKRAAGAAGSRPASSSPQRESTSG